MEKITILIVDDHKLIRETWKYLLSTKDYFQVVGDCGDPEEAIEIAKNKRPHIILMDIDMPTFSGIEATKMVRRFSPGSRIIGVSMHFHPTYVKKMFHAGAKGFITKNSSSEEMLHGIMEVYKGNEFICSDIKNNMPDGGIGKDETELNINSLTTREMEVISYIKAGLSSREMASILNISLKTVQGHRHNIHKKLKLKNSASLVNLISNSPTLILSAMQENN
jgi:DNA-binding NarL/FixJ family response regulator